MITLESILTNFLTSYMQDCFFAMPATVIAVRSMDRLELDVQPLPNREFKDGDSSEYPVLYSVPVMMPYTGTSAILMPVNSGDTVMLLFSQRGIDEFKSGSDIPYDTGKRFLSIQDAVAIIGISPFNKSPNQQSKHTLPHNPKDLTVVHNLGTPNECEVRLQESGNINITSPASINITSADISLNGVLTINESPYLLHKHLYPLPTPSGPNLAMTNIVSVV
jgi:hypothetical protein